MDNELAIRPDEVGLTVDVGGILREPTVVLSEAQRAAASLKSVIANKAKPVIINGEQYLEYEDWQVIGQFYGYTVKTGEAVQVEIEGVFGARATAVLFDKHGTVMGGAEAYCMRDEPKWTDKPWLQLASMAQTRAGAKSFRNRLAWVAVMAGYKPTPAEEMAIETSAKTQAATTPRAAETVAITNGTVADVRKKTIKTKNGDKEIFIIVDDTGASYDTWSESWAKAAKDAKEKDLQVAFEFTSNAYGKHLKGLSVQSTQVGA